MLLNWWSGSAFSGLIGRLLGPLPVGRVAGAPLADPLGIGGALEVVGVGWLVQPKSLTTAFAGLSAGIGAAEALASAVARIRLEEPATMQASG